MRARKNEATLRLLKFVASNDKEEAQEIAKRLDASIPSTSAILLRLTRWQQLSRVKLQNGTVVMDAEEDIERPRYAYVYSITERGLGRLKILEKRMSKKR